MGLTNQLAIEIEQLYNHWANIRITDKQVRKLIEVAMAPSKALVKNIEIGNRENISSQYINIVNDVYEYLHSAPSQQEQTTNGTLFGAYNAVTGYVQNVRKFSTEEHKLKSVIFGTGLQRAQSAFDLCNDFARHGNISLN